MTEPNKAAPETPVPDAPSGALARADRQLARSVLAVFVLAGVVAVLGPLLSYQSDIAQLQDLFRSRVVRESDEDANALARHLGLLQSELSRLADRPEVDLLDSSMQPERELLDSTHRQSTLFDTGVAIFDRSGTLAWSEPATLKAEGLAGGGWFARMTSTQHPVIDLAGGGEATFIVAVPILRDLRVTGALVGVSRAMRTSLSPTSSSDPIVRVLRDARGGLTMPSDLPTWANAADLRDRLREFPGNQTAFQSSAGGSLFAWRAPVGETGLMLIEVGNEELVTVPVRYRFRLQMLLLISLQAGAVLLLSLFLQRTYARFLSLERQGQTHERLLTLGTASSLIAHEVKNSLNGLQAATSLLASSAGSGTPDFALPLQSMKGEVDRLKHLASSLLLFGKPAQVRMQETGLPQLVREVVEGLVLPEVDEVRIDVEAPDKLDIECDPLMLTTAIHNLVRNAVEAVVAAKDLGKIAAPAMPRVLVRVASRDGLAVVEVEDNAGGVTPDVGARLFEPFVTGKPKGIGLGLSMTRRAMEAQRGTVSYEPVPGGSRFAIRLPVRPESAAARRPAE